MRWWRVLRLLPGYLLIIAASVGARSLVAADVVSSSVMVDERFPFAFGGRIVVLTNGAFLAASWNDLRKCNGDGTADATFTNRLAVNEQAAVLTNGEIVCLVSGQIVKLAPSSAFIPGFGVKVAGSITQLRVTQDNKIVIAGPFTAVNNVSRPGIARISADGVVDDSFSPPDLDFRIGQIAVGPDGRIFVANQRTNSEGGMVRCLTISGAVDGGFTNGVTDFGITRIEAPSTNRIYVGGEFDTYNGTVRLGLARLLGNGALDTGFVFTAKYPKRVDGICEDWTGRVVIATGSSMSNGVQGIIRLNHDGSQDLTFDPGFAFAYGFDVAVMSGHQLIATGTIRVRTNETLRSIVRLIEKPPRLQEWRQVGRELYFTGPIGSRFVLEGSTNLTFWTPVITNVFGAGSFMHAERGDEAAPMRFFRVYLPGPGE